MKSRGAESLKLGYAYSDVRMLSESRGSAVRQAIVWIVTSDEV
jgi:hypothetical protein